MEGKYLDLSRAYATMSRIINDENIPYADRLILYRLQCKLADNREFELKVNKEFSASKLKLTRDVIEYRIENRLKIALPLEFRLEPHLKTKWRLYQFDEVFLSGLDDKLARRIAYDINVAYSLKFSDRKLSDSDK